MKNLLANLNFKDGLIAAVIVDADEHRLLTLCYMDEEALEKTLRTGQVHVFRRSKGRVMLKGETSGHTQQVRQIRIDCNGNSIEFLVGQRVAACHVGYRSCYYRTYDPETDSFTVTDERVFDPEDVYDK